MAYYLENASGKRFTLNKKGGMDGFATKREVKIVKAYLQLKFPRAKIRILKKR